MSREFDSFDFENNQGATRMQLMQRLSPYLAQVSLDKNAIFCGDERDSDLNIYIHWFGGITNPIYNDAVMQETDEPGSVTASFKELVATGVPVYQKRANVKGGVHSDEQSEGGPNIKTDVIKGPVGCGYVLKRAPISGLLYAEREAMITDLQELLPEYFEDDQDIQYAYDVTEAHQRLVERSGFASPGREVVLEALKHGALAMNVRGDHVSRQGVLNLDPNVSLQTPKAMAADLATYWHDSGSVDQAQSRVSHRFTAKQRRIANALDALATMRALGVDYIEVNRTTKVLQPA